MAYVGIKPNGIDNFGEDSQVIKTTRKNYGLTPAIDVFMPPIKAKVFEVDKKGIAINLSESQFDPAPCMLGTPPNTFALFPAEESLDDLRGITILENNQAMTKEQIDQVRNGSHAMMVWGTVNFKDIFGTPHCTRYCWMFRGLSMGKQDAAACFQHNDTR
jgi:hypothetical protein